MLSKQTSNRVAVVCWTTGWTKALSAFLMSLLFILAIILSVQPVSARSAHKSFADLAEKLLPAVVNISSSQAMRSSQRQQKIPQVPPGSPFEDFLKEFFDRNGQEGAPRRASSLGSGFIIDKAGFVVTNNHVIAEADEITVILQDDSRHEAKLIGRDPKTDLALLKIEVNRDLPFLSWGNSTAARVGDWVVAIGNPFGLGGTVTAGIISARQRDINQGPYDNFLQTDASINRGNSGGPMFNMDGQVIGVNTAIFSPTGGSVGVGFSIPSSIAERVVIQLRDFGRTKRGWLGVRIQSVTDEIAESLGLDKASGALVADVMVDGPAEKSNIKTGDVILKFDGKMVGQMRDLPRIVAETEIGKPVRVEVWRKNRRRNIDVVVGELEEERSVLASTSPGGQAVEPEEAEIESLGVAVTAITEEMREQFNVSEDVKGVLVTGVTADSGAAEKGLRPGDIIVEINQEEVSSPGQIASKVSEAMDNDRRSVLLLVNRNGNLRFVAVRVDSG
jgi:serine protease Do